MNYLYKISINGNPLIKNLCKNLFQNCNIRFVAVISGNRSDMNCRVMIENQYFIPQSKTPRDRHEVFMLFI